MNILNNIYNFFSYGFILWLSLFLLVVFVVIHKILQKYKPSVVKGTTTSSTVQLVLVTVLIFFFLAFAYFACGFSTGCGFMH